MLDCGHGQISSSTLAESGLFVFIRGCWGESGYHLTSRFTLIHHEYSKTTLRVCRCATVVALS